MSVPDDIRFLYFIECGFYMHSLYATIYMDAWRKDFFVMILHHFLTMVLIIASYATRYHKIGILVIFVHDVTDILLEFTKCNVYLKSRNGRKYAFHDMIANIGFATFTFIWYSLSSNFCCLFLFFSKQFLKNIIFSGSCFVYIGSL